MMELKFEWLAQECAGCWQKNWLCNSGLPGSREKALDRRLMLLSKDVHPQRIGWGVCIFLLLVQCHIEPQFLNLSFVAGAQCAWPGCPLRTCSPFVPHGGHSISPESHWQLCAGAAIPREAWGLFTLGHLSLSAKIWKLHPFGYRLRPPSSVIKRHLTKLECVGQLGRCLRVHKSPPWRCLLDRRKDRRWPLLLSPSLAVCSVPSTLRYSTYHYLIHFLCLFSPLFSGHQ